MALGGGSFTAQNKILPGTYINFVSANRASTVLSERGYIAAPFELDWGIDNEIFTVEVTEVQENAIKLFGYSYGHEKLKNVREVFKNAKTLYCYRLNSGSKAENSFAVAKCSGIRGNDIRIVIQNSVDYEDYFDVITMIDNTQIDIQTVKSADELKSNDLVKWKRGFTLSETAGTPLSGGTNKSQVESMDYQNFLDKAESCTFNILCCPSANKQIINLFVEYTKRLRDESGIKFQTVVYKTSADYEGIISVENKVLDDEINEASLVYWLSGASAGCSLNKSNTNKVYDGEYEIDTNYKQSQLEDAIKSGKLMFHKLGDSVRILEDINTLVSVTDNNNSDDISAHGKNSDFCSNQVIRTLDQIGNDIAVLFVTSYLGTPNDNAGRISFWSALVKMGEELEKNRAIENFEPSDVKVERGADKKSVLVTFPISATMGMSKLYMQVIVQ